MKNTILTIFILALFLSASVAFGKKQKQSINKQEMAKKVKAEFQHAWNGYMTYANGHDALNPISKGFHDWYAESLVMTPVDAFSTMHLMGLQKEMDEAKDLIFNNLSFDKDFYVQHFEISIRLLGGLISSYQLDGDDRFIKLAEDLATRMLPVWETPTGIPWRFVNLKTGAVRDSLSFPAEMGTYLPEYASLSEITGNPIFKEKAEKAMLAIFNARSEIGLVGSSFNVLTGKWIDQTCHIRGGVDSYWEYVYKSYLILDDSTYLNEWNTYKAALDKHLPQQTESGYWYSAVDMNTGERKITNYGALDAFYAGVLCLAGDVEQAKKLQESNFLLWTNWGIEPEAINYETMEILDWGTYYMLRPENIESAFYLYRFTDDEKYLEMGVEYYNSLVKYCRNDVAYAHIKDVRTMEQLDAMESFFLAETLKYLYLIFAPESTFNFDTHVFNTEAHPLKKIQN